MLVEDEDINEDDENEIIFQQYLNRHKQSSNQQQRDFEEIVTCKICKFRAESTQKMKEHMANVHRENAHHRQKKPRVQYCHFWNNAGGCNFEERNKRPCKFEHQRAPRCKYDGECNRKRCMYSHQVQNQAFLAPSNGLNQAMMNHPFHPMWFPQAQPFMQPYPRRIARRN